MSSAPRIQMMKCRSAETCSDGASGEVTQLTKERRRYSSAEWTGGRRRGSKRPKVMERLASACTQRRARQLVISHQAPYTHEFITLSNPQPHVLRYQTPRTYSRCYIILHNIALRHETYDIQTYIVLLTHHAWRHHDNLGIVI